jgi:hypothetical protein
MQGDVEGDNVTVDGVVHNQVAVMAELGRVGGETHSALGYRAPAVHAAARTHP